ncbi:MAG TPA: right-handed parallel beta-helix repeat-containing protein [Steroidobacteraceae bacterium]
MTQAIAAAGMPRTFRVSRAWLRAAQIALCLAGLQCGAAFADSTANCSITPPLPAVPGTARIFARAPGADETAAIQEALNGLQTGDWLVFPAGTYNISQYLTVTTPGVTLYGKGATIHSTSATDGALWIKADNVAVYGFTLQQDSTSRQSTPWAGGLAVYDDRGGGRTVDGAVIQDNTIDNSAAVGIFVLRAENFTVAGNVVWRSWADGIHMTGGAFNGRVINNAVSQTGDDMISVVSYAAGSTPAPAASSYSDWPAVQSRLVRNIYIAGNTASDQYWGRGISVVGGSDVTIENNTVSRTPMAAAVYLTRETADMTFGDHDILVRNNALSQIQTMAPSYLPPGVDPVLTGHGAIEVGSTMSADEYANPTWRQAFSMSGIAILNNTVDHARFAGIRVGVGTLGSAVVTASSGSKFTQTLQPGAVQDVTVQSDALSSVDSSGVIDAHSGLDGTTISCGNNTVNGVAWQENCTSTIAGSAATPVVNGASMQCTAAGALVPTVSPTAPALLPPN